MGKILKILKFAVPFSTRRGRCSAANPLFLNKLGKIPGRDSPEWQKTIPVKRFFDKTEGVVEDTEISIMNDHKNLYILFDCKQVGEIIMVETTFGKNRLIIGKLLR